MSWYSAQELAEKRLPGLPVSKPGILSRAKKEGWRSRIREKSGGGTEFSVRSLPEDARAVLFDQAVQQNRPVEKAAPEDSTAQNLNDFQRDVMGARKHILDWLDDLAAQLGVSVDEAICHLCSRSKSGKLPPDIAAKIVQANAKSGRKTGSVKKTVSYRTIYYWRKALSQQGLAGLAPQIANQDQVIIPDWAPFLVNLWQNPKNPSLKAVLDDLALALPVDIDLPSYDAARRFLSKLSPQTKMRGRVGAQGLKAYKAFTRRDVSDLVPGDVYTADGHTFRANIEHPFNGQPFKPEVTTVLDVKTRYAVGWSVAFAENSLGVLEALSMSMIDRQDDRKAAVPAIFYTDNGSGFKNYMMGDDATGFLARTGITGKFSLPYNSQARGIIERFQQFWQQAAKQLNSYNGRYLDKEHARHLQKITNRDLRAGKKAPFVLIWDEFKAFIQGAIDHYNNTPHSGLPRVRDPETKRYRYMTPLQAWTAFEQESGVSLPVIARDDAADLFRPYERRKVARGEVQILSQRYFSHELDAWHGEEVLVGYDIHDGSRVWVKDFEGRLLAIAEHDGNARPYFDNAVIDQARSFREIKDDQRQQGRIQRAEAKVAKVRSEAAPILPMLEVGKEAVIDLPITPAVSLDPAPMTGKQNSAASSLENEATEPARPLFTDDYQLAIWAAQHPDQLTDQQKNRVATALRKPGFLKNLQLAGVDLSALDQLAA